MERVETADGSTGVAATGVGVGRVSWQVAELAALPSTELYELMALRQRVFVVEQQCVYLDADGHDVHCAHLLGRIDGELLACARLVPPGLTYADASIGRVAIDPRARGTGLGHELVREAVREVRRRHAGPVTIGAQLYLRAFYERHGFVAVSEPYDEDGIAHLDMTLAADPA